MYNPTRDRIEQLVAYWRRVFRLHDGWQINLTVHTTREEAEASDTLHEATADGPAYIRIQYGYSRANLYVNSYLVKDDQELVYDIGHEVAHIPSHRPEQLIRASLGPANATTAEEMGEELAELLVHACLACVAVPPPLPPEPLLQLPPVEKALPEPVVKSKRSRKKE